MKCLLAIAVALLIASGFGMFVAIYSACRRQARNKRCPLCLCGDEREQCIFGVCHLISPR